MYDAQSKYVSKKNLISRIVTHKEKINVQHDGTVTDNVDDTVV